MKYLSSWMLFESRDPNDIRKFNKKEKLTVYHRTKDEIVSKVGRDGFRSGGGNAWGDGIYACYDLISTTKENPYNQGNDRVNSYGPVIIESEVVSLKDYLIFDYDVAKQYFGKNYDIITQIKNLVPEEVFELNKKIIENIHKICLSHRDNPLGESKYTSDAVREIYDIDAIMDHVRGLVFTGGWDGKVLLSYDRENLIPIRYSKDNGKNWKKLTEKGAYKAAKDNFSKLISNESDVEKIKDKIKDRINNTITTQFGPEKNLKNLDFNELRNIKSEFSYIYQDSANNRVVYPEKSKKYEDYKKTLSIVRKEIDEVFSVAATGVKSNLFNFIEKINWSDDIIEIIKSVIKEFQFKQMYRDFKSDSSVIEKLDEMKKKISDIYLKEYNRNLLDISKDDDFFIKYIDFLKKYKYIVSTINDELLISNDFSFNYFFDNVIEKINQFDNSSEIIKNISENLEKKVLNFFNNYQDKSDISRISLQKPKNEIFANLDFEKFSKEYSFMEFYKVVSNINFDLEEILSSIKYGEIKYYNGYESKTYKIKDFIQILNSSIIKIANVHTKKFEQLNQNIEKLFNDTRDRILNFEYKYYSFAHKYNQIWNKIDTNDDGIFSNFILFISSIEDRSILNQLTKEGFLKEKTSKILKMLFLGSVSKTKSDYGKDVETYLEFTDLQKSESNKIFESEFNNPEFIPVFKATQPNEKNFRCFNKLKLEGKDVSNWTTWIKIYLLNCIVDFRKADKIYIDHASEKLREKYSLDEVLNQFINLNLNVFSKKFFESEEIQILNQDGEIISRILNSFVRLKKDDQNIINKHFQYLDKIKDKIEKEVYYCYIFSLIDVLGEGENLDKLISLVDKQSVEFFNTLNKCKDSYLSINFDNLLKILLQKNIISLSDCLKNNLHTDMVQKFANYKLRKIIEENNLEKIKSFLDFLKQNKISLFFKNSNEWGSLLQPFPFEKIDIKLLPVEVIEKIIENDQVEFYTLSENIGKNDELVRKLMKFINKKGFENLLKCVEDPKLKEEIMLKRLESSNDFNSNFETFQKFGPKKVNLEKLVKDLNETYSEKRDYFFDILIMLITTDKKDEILRKIDKNILSNFIKDFSDDDFQEKKKEFANGKFFLLLKEGFPIVSEFSTPKNILDTINVMKEYLSEDAKTNCQKIIDAISYTSERIILSYKSFRRI